MGELELSRRLQAVANLVEPTECVADIGTDHGYIPIYLIQRGICKKVLAMDVRKGPLQRAEEHIQNQNLQEHIETRLSDGLEHLRVKEAQEIIIAGMGGATMQMILERGKKIMQEGTVLVLQPQSEVKEFRTYLVRQGFEFLEEDMVVEDGKYYPMMKVKKSNVIVTYSPLELLYGPLLLEKKHKVLKEYLCWQLEQKKSIGEKIQRSASKEKKILRMRELEEEMCQIQEALKQYEEY